MTERRTDFLSMPEGGTGGGTGATADQLAQIAQNAEDIAELKGDLLAMTTATAEDVGKVLKVNAVTDGKVASWEFGETGGGGERCWNIITSATLTQDAAEIIANGFSYKEIMLFYFGMVSYPRVQMITSLGGPQVFDYEFVSNADETNMVVVTFSKLSNYGRMYERKCASQVVNYQIPTASAACPTYHENQNPITSVRFWVYGGAENVFRSGSRFAILGRN